MQPIPPIQPGDVLPAYEAPAPFRPGRSRWHALLVFPQRERAAKAWFGKWSMDAFYPVRTAHRWQRNVMVPYQQTYLPGYLFVNFPGEPRWHLLFGDERHLIRNVLRMSDGVTPGELHPDTLVRLEAMRDVDVHLAERIRLRRALRRGDKAKLNAGPLAGMEVEVVRVGTSGTATFEMMLMGRMVGGEARLEALDKVGEDQ